MMKLKVFYTVGSSTKNYNMIVRANTCDFEKLSLIVKHEIHSFDYVRVFCVSFAD